MHLCIKIGGRLISIIFIHEEQMYLGILRACSIRVYSLYDNECSIRVYIIKIPVAIYMVLRSDDMRTNLYKQGIRTVMYMHTFILNNVH